MNPNESNLMPPSVTTDAPLIQRVMVWLKLGITSFGGLAGQVALFYEVLVKDKQWITEKSFFRAVNYCIILPGATGHQLATYCGWLTHGVRGGILSGLLYVIPGALLMLSLSTAYVLTQHLAIVQSIFLGIKAAIVIFIAESLVSLSKNILKSPKWFILATITFLGLFLFQISFATVMLIAVVFGIIFSTIKKLKETYFWPHKPTLEELHVLHPNPVLKHPKPKTLNTLKVVVIGLLIWWLPIWLLGLFAGLKSLFFEQAVFVSKVAMIAFGGTYPVLGYVAHTVIDKYHWLSPQQMLDGLGMMISMPGPVILVLQFISFITAFQHAAFTYPVFAGFCASLVCFWATFTPCFLWIFIGAPYVEYLSDIDFLKNIFRSITAAVFGVIANLAIWFGMNVLFTKVNHHSYGYITVQFPDLSTLQYDELVLTILAAVLLFKCKLSVLKTIGITSMAGVLLYFVTH